jgi:hypothetical protein
MSTESLLAKLSEDSKEQGKKLDKMLDELNRINVSLVKLEVSYTHTTNSTERSIEDIDNKVDKLVISIAEREKAVDEKFSKLSEEVRQSKSWSLAGLAIPKKLIAVIIATLLAIGQLTYTVVSGDPIDKKSIGPTIQALLKEEKTPEPTPAKTPSSN